MSILTDVEFADPALRAHLDEASDEALDQLRFGVIAFDRECIVRRYNAWESKAAGLSPSRVIGQHLFATVAPCMNNYLVAHAFEEAQSRGEALDTTLPYVLTLRMRPTKVQLRLLAPAGDGPRYVVILRSA